MDHLMDVEVMEKAADAETALKQVKECIKFKDSKGLKTAILEHKLKDQSVFWEIASELTANLTEENLEQHEYFFETCQRCMNYVIANGNPKELLLAVLEQADSFKDDQKFKCILENVQKILLKLPNKRHHSLDVTLETLSAHIEAIPQPKDHNLDHEERKLLEMDPSVMRATDVVLCYLEFLSPFVEEVSMRNPKVTFSKSTPQVQLLVKYLMKLLSHPLYHLDMTFKLKEQEEKEKSYSRVCAERLIDQLAQLCPNFFALIEDETKKRSMRAKLKESEAREDEDDESLVGEDEDKVKDWKEDKLIPENSLACLSYLVLAEGLGLDRMPAVYSHKFMLRFHLPFIKSFLEDQHSIVKLKGVLLLEKLMFVIPPMSFTHYELDNDFYKDILNLLISTMTHCQNKDIRKSCVPIYSNFIGMFSLQGRHRLYETVFNTCKHSGVVGHTLSLYKEQVDSLLKKGEGPENIFLGKNLIRVFKLVSVIPDGVTTDLLENSDRILSVLNFVRYLVLRDNPAENRTGFWELYPNLDKEFFEPLRQAIILSKGHYNLDLEDVRKGNPLPTENTEFSVNVGGERLGPVSREQQIQVIDSALNTFDMMDSILSRTIELVDAQKRSVKVNQADILSRCNKNGGRLMCSSTGDRNPYQNTSSGPGGSASSQTSNGGYNTQGTGQESRYTDELDNSENLLNEIEEEEMPEESEEEFQTKQAVLKASLPFVHQYGWTKKAIVAGAESLGMPPMVHGMFPRGGAELVFYFYEESNKELEAFLKQKVKESKEKDEKIKTGPFIHDAIETRLRMIIPYIDKWPQAMAIQTLPQNAVQSWTNLSRVVDDIWFYAGDKSNDFNWYTKRVSLAAVYKSTEIYLIQDRSEDYTDTWHFLENRLEDVVSAGHLARNLQETNTVLSEGAKGFCLMTRNLLGMNNR